MLPPIFQSMSAIREWETLMRQIGAIAESAVDATARPERLWLVNQLETLIESTAHGELVGDSTYTREAALAARQFVQAFLAWSQTEITVDTLEDGTLIQMSPMAIITLR
jgi:hypothetical protein